MTTPKPTKCDHDNGNHWLSYEENNLGVKMPLKWSKEISEICPFCTKPTEEEVARSIIYKDNFFKQYAEIVPDVGERLEGYVFSIRDYITEQRQAWEKEKAELISKLGKDAAILKSLRDAEKSDLEKEKAGLEERVKFAEQDRDSWRRCAERLETEKTEPKLIINIEESAIKDLFKNQAEEITRLKARNEELEIGKKSDKDEIVKMAEAICMQANENTRLKAENYKLRKDWLIEPHEETSEGFWGRSCARLQQKNDRLSASLAAAHRALKRIKDAYEMRFAEAPYNEIADIALSDPTGQAAHERWKRMEAVVEAARNMMKVDPSLLNNSLGSAYAIKHYCEVKDALKALEAKGGV